MPGEAFTARTLQQDTLEWTMGRGKANTHTGRSRCQEKSKNQINFNLENKQKRVGKMPKQAKTCTARQYNKAGREKEMKMEKEKGRGDRSWSNPSHVLQSKRMKSQPSERGELASLPSF